MNPSRAKPAWTKWALRLIGVALLAVILVKIGRRSLIATLQQADWRGVAVAGGLCLAHFLLKACRWNFIVSRAGVRVGQWTSGKAYFSAMLLGLVTPGRIGEFVKAAMVRRWSPATSWGAALGTVVLDRLLDVGVFLLVALWGLVRVGLPGEYHVAGEVGLAALLALGCVLALAAWRRVMKTEYSQRVKQLLLRKIGPSAGDFYRVLRQIFEPCSAPTYLLTLLAYILFFAYFIVLSRAMGSAASPRVLGWAIACASLAALLPVSIGGLGVRDFVLLAILQTWHEDPARVLALSLSYVGLMYLVALVTGLGPFLAGEINREVALPPEGPPSDPR